MRILAACLLATLLAFSAVAQQPAPPPPTHLKVGDKAPDFTMRDQSNKPVKLADFKGKNVVLAFYVLAFTGG
jgi:cytochrome oxidase Cu insertion factor (SCO1/SenC/PrrC family)